MSISDALPEMTAEETPTDAVEQPDALEQTDAVEQADVVEQLVEAPRPRRRRARKRGRRGVGFCAMVLLILISLILAVAGTLFALVVLAPQPAAAKSQATTARDLAVTVDDAFLTRQATAALAKATLPMKVSNVAVHIAANGVLNVSGDLPNAPRLPGQPLRRFTAVLLLTVHKGMLAATVQSLTFGALVLPAALVATFATSLTGAFVSAANGLLALSSWRLSSLSSASGALTVYLAAR